VSLKILLADDSLTAQNMGKKILADAGYEVIAVSNGAQAMKKIAADSPDLVVLDVYMPGYSGVEVCERIRSSRETATIPVVLSVGKMEAFRPEEGTRVHADGLIVKPFEATELLAVIKKLVTSAASTAKRHAPQTASADPASVPNGAEAESDTPPEFEIQHQSVDVPKEVASAPAIGMELIPEEAQQSPSAEFELERSPEPAQVEAGRMAAADGLSGVFELDPSPVRSSVPEASVVEREESHTSAKVSSKDDAGTGAFELTTGPGAYQHGPEPQCAVEEPMAAMGAVSGTEPELLDQNNRAANTDTECSPEPVVLPELSSWDEPLAPAMLETRDASAASLMETPAPALISPLWIAEEVEVGPEDRAISLHEQMQHEAEITDSPAGDVLETPRQVHHRTSADASLAVEPSPSSEPDNPLTVAPQPAAASEAVVREAALDPGRITTIVEQLLERLKPEVIAAVNRELGKKQ
jgi:DNA-binding response OmpR family regulator